MREFKTRMTNNVDNDLKIQFENNKNIFSTNAIKTIGFFKATKTIR